jgi:hypothetical protein
MNKEKNKSILWSKVDKLVRKVVEDEEDDLLEETVKVILKKDESVDKPTP